MPSSPQIIIDQSLRCGALPDDCHVNHRQKCDRLRPETEDKEAQHKGGGGGGGGGEIAKV